MKKLLPILLIVILFAGCKKDDKVEDPNVQIIYAISISPIPFSDSKHTLTATYKLADGTLRSETLVGRDAMKSFVLDDFHKGELAEIKVENTFTNQNYKVKLEIWRSAFGEGETYLLADKESNIDEVIELKTTVK